MFSLLSGCISACRARPSVKLLILGLDGAGKTVLLEQLKSLYKAGGVDVEKIPPTVGLNLGNISNCKGFAVTLWDLGGHENLRQIWPQYYDEADAVIFVVDSSDTLRLTEVRKELRRVLDAEALQGRPMLVLANKDDLPFSKTAVDIEKALGLPAQHRRKIRFQDSSGLTCKGLKQAMEWSVTAGAEAKRAVRGGGSGGSGGGGGGGG